VRVGIGLNKVGRRAEGIAHVEDGIRQYRDGLRQETNHGEGLYYAFELLEPATEFYLDTNLDDKAIGLWDEYILMAEPFVENNPDDITSLGLLAHALERKGDVLAKYQKDRDAFDQTDTTRLRSALATYNESLRRQQRIRELDPTNPSHLESEKALELKVERLKGRLK
jgi:hypothetical protein